MVGFKLWPLYLLGKKPRYPFSRRFSDVQSHCGLYGKGNIS
jgi:hypothetical protein